VKKILVKSFNESYSEQIFSISNRLIPALVDLISQTQKTFLKGIYIGECTRLIFDLIEKMEEDDIPDLLVFLDFEKSFDTVECSFLYKTLHFFGLGKSFCSWIKTFYNVISSFIINNGHSSDYFKLGRGVRQVIRCPLIYLYCFYNYSLQL
jgi:hypothetical protein